jgi:hypothetical protein
VCGMDDKFTQSFSGADWAKAFMEQFRERKGDIDEELMLGWFCNAIMRGYDEHARRYPLGEKI